MKKCGEWWTQSWAVRAPEAPLHWRKPRIVKMTGDLFHETVPDADIDQRYAVMALCPQHRFVVLTEWAERRARYLHADLRSGPLSEAIIELRTKRGIQSVVNPLPHLGADAIWYPLSNIIETVSASTQAELDERWPWLAKTPAAKRGLHLEPLLAPVDPTRLNKTGGGWLNALDGKWRMDTETCTIRIDEPSLAAADWVVVSGETGPNARPCHPDWVRAIRDQCRAAGVPLWFKGWGKHIATGQHDPEQNGRLLDGRTHEEVPW